MKKLLVILTALLFIIQANAQWVTKKQKADELMGTEECTWYMYTSSLGNFSYASTNLDFFGITTNKGIFDFNNGVLECTIGFYNTNGKLIESEKCIIEYDEEMPMNMLSTYRSYTNEAKQAIDSLIDNYISTNNISKTEETVEFLYHLFDHEIDSIKVNLEEKHNFYIEDKVINYLKTKSGKVRFILPRYHTSNLDFCVPCKKKK